MPIAATTDLSAIDQPDNPQVFLEAKPHYRLLIYAAKFTVTQDAAPVAEPATLTLLGLGTGGYSGEVAPTPQAEG